MIKISKIPCKQTNMVLQDLFLYAYWNYMVSAIDLQRGFDIDFTYAAVVQINGQWFGSKGLFRPNF